MLCTIGQVLFMIGFLAISAGLIIGPLKFFVKFAGEFSFQYPIPIKI